MKESIQALASSFQKMLGLSVASELYGTKHKTPKFICNIGEDCYTDNKAIVVGFKHPTFYWCKSKADYYENADYIKGHEVQHIKSTTNKAWKYAIKRGSEVVIEALCKKEGIGIRLNNDRDYEMALTKLRDKGVYISTGALQHITHFVANSLEDGRIEAIRAAENEVFKKQMIHIRLLGWSNEPIQAPSTSVDKMSANEKLMIILNQILSLATSSVYQKGFASEYYNTELKDRVEEVIPNIAKGITAKRCRDMATESIAICEKLADLIGEAAKISSFESHIINWIRASIKDFDLSERNTSESDEEENTAGKNPFGNSDLYVILPDDEYDELMDKLKDRENDEEDDEDAGKIHVRREHPKEEDTEPENEDGASSAGESEEREDDNSPSSGNNADGPSNNSESSENEADNASAFDNESGESSESNETGNESASDFGNAGDDDDYDMSGESDTSSTSKKDSFDQSFDGDGHEQEAGGEEVSSDNADKQSQGQRQQNGESGKQQQAGNRGGEANMDDIYKAMEEAAEAANGAAEEDCNIAEQIIRKQEKAQDMAQDETEPVKKTDQATIDKINSHYSSTTKLNEVERRYTVDTMIPPEIMREIETLRKKFETFLHGKKRRHRKQLIEGKLDSGRVAMLAANEINVFKKTKISKDVSACAEIILDNSGSMGWGNPSKRYSACIALTKIEMIFSEYFPIKMLAFDECGSVIHEIIKNWNEHFSRSAAYNFLTKGRYGSGNFDSYSIRVATEDILTRPEKKKLLIVLSDGAPCEDPQNVTDAVREARAKGIKVIGIYFDDTYDDCEPDGQFFADMYEKDYIVCRPCDIGENLLQVCKSFFA